MKQTFTLLLFFVSLSLSAQLSDGSTAPNFSLDDLNGTTHDLYDYTSQGYSVILDFSATWCGPCWNYHQTGILEDLWDEFGPGGTDQLMVFMIEADPATSQPCIYGPSGCSGGSIGDWTAGVNYPILNPPPAEAAAINNDYDIAYFPTLYGVAPNNEIYEIGQASFGEWESWVIESFQMLNSTWEINATDCDLSSIDFMLNEGFGNIEYEWSTGASSEDLEDLEAGDYYLTVIDDHNFEVEFGPIEVENDNYAEIFLNDLVNVGCHGDHTGYLSIEIEGGSGDFEYEWNSGHDEAVLEDIPSGDYEVTVTDVDSGCEFEADYYIEQPDQLYVDYELEPASCDGNTNGAVDFIIDGGTYPFNFIFEEFETNDPFIVLEPGEYDVTIMDYNGCDDFASFTIEAAEAPTAMSDALGQFNCVTDTVYVVADSSSMGPDIEYNWYDPSNIFVGSGYQVQVDSAGTYTLEVYDDELDCSSFSTVTVVENYTSPVALASNLNDLDCNNSAVMVTGQGSTMDTVTNYMWITNDGIIDTDPTQLDIMVSASGIYTLMVTNIMSGCVSMSSTTVNEVGTPEIELTGETEFCEGTSSVLCITEKIDESTEWYIDGNLVSNDACVTVDETSSITVTLTNDNTGCSSNEAVQATVIDAPEVALEGELSICEGATSTLCANADANDQVEWFVDGQSAGNLACITVSTSAVVDLEVTNALGCIAMESVQVDYSDNPVATVATPDILDCNQNTTLLDLTTDNTANQVFWYDEQNNLLGTTEDIEVDQAGEYMAVVINSAGCEIAVNVAVDANLDELPTAMFAFQSLDYDFQFEDSSIGTINNRLWDFGDGNTSTEMNPSHSYSGPGYYNVCLTSMNDCGDDMHCTEVLATTAMQISSVIENVSCFGENDGSIQANVFGGLPGYSYEWAYEGQTLTGNPITNLSPGDYTLKVTDAAGAVIEDAYTIQEPEQLQVSGTITNDVDAEANGSIELSVFGGSGTSTVEWSNGMTGYLIEGLPAGDYTAVVTDERNCQVTETYTVEASVNVNELTFVKTFGVSPNPAKDIVRINIGLDQVKAYTVSLVSLLGQRHWSEKYIDAGNDLSLDISSIPNGIYLVELRSEGKISLKKLVIH